ncbi:hypothetical protein CIW49_26965 [Mycolicibacterium sp. P1-18]|uniref:hypothetical protein n=1 Tax=Mycolicibacterium sp. P1-18 TaxID=2024615 RepID=UPI0011F27D76|nr:hypothetical protein [Mycolicibacterium sp. P1-18]KAA0093685.1 hypothetical protein CIW49_26965 [Mycolicibacterium sp. P1-18]
MPANRVTVVPEDLVASGEQVSVHADELLTTHTATTSWVESSLPYLPAAGAAALAAKSAKWQAVTTTLTGRLSEHSEALHGSAMGYQRVDGANAATIGAVAEGLTGALD